MISSRRKEPFRYLFVPPEICLFAIRELNGQQMTTREAPADLLDWHKSGCKIATTLDLQAASNKVKLQLDFPFVEESPISVVGSVRWQRRHDDQWLYGVKFEVDDTTRERIKLEIRRLAAARKINAL